MARGVIKTGLGEHLAYHFISILGKKTLGIAYSIAFCETILLQLLLQILQEQGLS